MLAQLGLKAAPGYRPVTEMGLRLVKQEEIRDCCVHFFRDTPLSTSASWSMLSAGLQQGEQRWEICKTISRRLQYRSMKDEDINY